MIAAAPEPRANQGQPEPRSDGRLKVTGEARYPADVAVDNPAYAFLVTSAIARGSLTSLDLAAARAVPGVLDILTHENAGEVRSGGFFPEGGHMGSTTVPLGSTRIWHDGQIIAVVVADTFEAAREAAFRVGVRYAQEAPSATIGSPGVEIVDLATVSEKHKDAPKVGDVEAALASAAHVVDAEYSTPTQHHNPIELYSTTAVWHDDQLTIHAPSQFVYNFSNGVAQQLGLDPGRVRCISTFLGGGFGGKFALTHQTALAALAAKRINRPVRLVVTRDQGYTIATYRAETRHHVRLGADRDGRLVGYAHEGFELTSRPDNYAVAGTEDTCRQYAFGAVSTKVNLVRADRNTPGSMRSPPEVPYMFALESAMDELAAKIGIDPVEFRRRNDVMNDPVTGKPFTSRSLMHCIDEASAAFEWSRRTPAVGSMRDGDWLIGLGYATAAYPTNRAPATVRVKLAGDGKVTVQTAAHDIGTGAYTVIGQMAAERLGVPLANVKVELGDSALPPGPVAGGSNTTASVCSTVIQAADAIRDRLAKAAVSAADGPLAGRAADRVTLRDGALVSEDGESETFAKVFERIGVGVIEEYAEWQPKGAKPGGIAKLYKGSSEQSGGSKGDKMMFAYGAEFVEVRINARTREIKVPRIVGAFAAGRIMNTRTARSQLMGGLIWGIGSALHEQTEIDARAARYVNDNLSEYLIPVNADIQQLEVILVPETDTEVNPAGVKGLGELGNVGTAAAVTNAIYHATGKRIRDLPVRIEDLLSA